MGRTRSTPTAPDDAPTRSSQEALAEIGTIATVGVAIVVLVLALGGGPREIFASAVQGGNVMLAHIGWAFGVYVPVLLSFYLLIAGQDLSGRPSASRTRRMLGLAAELLVASLVPAILLVLVAAIEKPAQLASLLVIVPAFAVLVFLAAQLGSFIAFADEERRESALREQEWAGASLSALSEAPRHAAIVVVCANTLAAVASAGVVDLIVRPSSFTLLPDLLSFFLIAGLLSTANVLGLFLRFTSRSRSEKVTSAIGPVVASLLALAFAAGEMLSGRLHVGLGIVTVLVLLGVSALLPRRAAERGVRSWTLRSGGIAEARRCFERRLARATAEIERLSALDRVPSSAGRGPLVRLKANARARLRSFIA